MKRPMRCTWCIRDTQTPDRCDQCGSKYLSDPNLPHDPDWSRHTIKTWVCKVCDRIVDNTDWEAIGARCPGTAPSGA